MPRSCHRLLWPTQPRCPIGATSLWFKSLMSCAASPSCSAVIRFSCPGLRTRSHSCPLGPRSANFQDSSYPPERPVASRFHGAASGYPGQRGQCTPSISSCAYLFAAPLPRDLNQRATHENPLVMRSSLAGDEHQGAEVPTVARDRRRRARCVPDRPVNAGNSRSLPDSPIHRLTCVQAGRPAAHTDLLSSGSRVRILPDAPGQRLVGASADVAGAKKRGATRSMLAPMTQASLSKRRGQGEDSIY